MTVFNLYCTENKTDGTASCLAHPVESKNRVYVYGIRRSENMTRGAWNIKMTVYSDSWHLS